MALVFGELPGRQNLRPSDRSAMYIHRHLTLVRVRSALDGVLWGAWVGELGGGTVVRSRRGDDDWRKGEGGRLRSSIPFSRKLSSLASQTHFRKWAGLRD